MSRLPGWVVTFVTALVRDPVTRECLLGDLEERFPRAQDRSVPGRGSGSRVRCYRDGSENYRVNGHTSWERYPLTRIVVRLSMQTGRSG